MCNNKQKPKIKEKAKIYVPKTLYWMMEIDYLDKLDEDDKNYLTHANKFIYRLGKNDIINTIDKTQVSKTLNTKPQFEDALSRFHNIPIDEVVYSMEYKQNPNTLELISKLLNSSLSEEDQIKVQAASDFFEQNDYLPDCIIEHLLSLSEQYCWI